MGKRSKNTKSKKSRNLPDDAALLFPASAPSPTTPRRRRRSFLASILSMLTNLVLSVFCYFVQAFTLLIIWGDKIGVEKFRTNTGLSFDDDELLEKVLARGVGVGEHLNSKESLRTYMRKFSRCDPRFRPLVKEIWEGLSLGPPYINNRVSLSLGHDEPFPIIIWVCNWKQLRKIGPWHAESELVDMVLKAGANVDEELRNSKNTALHLAVRYADLKTVDLLLQAGANIKHKNNLNRTCIFNALEHPQPAVIQRLLERLPANDTVQHLLPDGTTYQATLADKVMIMLIERSPLLTWRILGVPSADSLIETLYFIRSKGGRFSPEGAETPFYVLGRLFRTDLPSLKSRLNEPGLFMEVAQSLVGNRIPQRWLPSNRDDDNNNSNRGDANTVDNFSDEFAVTRKCQLCRGRARKPILLYCGHIFCRNCIIEYGQQQGGSNCPVCHLRLCRDLHDQLEGNPSAQDALGLAKSPAYGNLARLTDEQVVAEAQFQEIYSRVSSIAVLRSKLQEGLDRGYAAANQGPQRVGVDLAAECAIANETTLYLCPAKGLVCIEVCVQNIPILARISNRSLYTVFSKAATEQLRLRKMPQLKSPKFVDVLNTRKIRKVSFQCLEPVTLQFGGINVTLRNAITMDHDPYPMFGVQLGCDFLMSGVWCPVDVEINSETTPAPSNTRKSMRLDGDISWLLGRKSKEMLRYYAHGGGIAKIPLLHFSPFDEGVLLGISLKESVKFDQCYWCCRAFPQGMLSCTRCRKATYCGSACQQAAWKIHRTVCDKDS